jgi:hypothetical protein
LIWLVDRQGQAWESWRWNHSIDWPLEKDEGEQLMTLFSALVGTIAVLVVHSQQPIRNVPTPAAAGQDHSAYSLATTLLNTLSLAATARDTLASVKPQGNPIADSFNAIVAQRSAVGRLNEAIALLGLFQTSADEPVRTAASTLKGIYNALAERLLADVSVWEKFARTKTADDIAALVPESAKNAADVQTVWRLLPLGVASITDALVDSTRVVDDKTPYLRLTRAERTKLATQIKALFPNLRPEEKGGQIVDVSVNLFREFLNGGWKSSDDK